MVVLKRTLPECSKLNLEKRCIFIFTNRDPQVNESNLQSSKTSQVSKCHKKMDSEHLAYYNTKRVSSSRNKSACLKK